MCRYGLEPKPLERIGIGDVVLIRSGSRSAFVIDGDARLLRDKDTIRVEEEPLAA